MAVQVLTWRDPLATWRDWHWNWHGQRRTLVRLGVIVDDTSPRMRVNDAVPFAVGVGDHVGRMHVDDSAPAVLVSDRRAE